MVLLTIKSPITGVMTTRSPLVMITWPQQVYSILPDGILFLHCIEDDVIQSY